MQLTQRLIYVIEMTRDEEESLYFTFYTKRMVCGKRVINWSEENNNEIQLEGESFYRQIVRPE